MYPEVSDTHKYNTNNQQQHNQQTIQTIINYGKTGKHTLIMAK